MSGHTQRRRSRQTRKAKTAGLNLVSLMDIFTILVFFLMVNSSEVEVLQTSSKIELPDSSSEKQPKNQLMISVDESDLVVQGRSVAKVADLQGSEDLMIAGLQTELEYQASRRGEIPEGGFEITVIGDKELPYWLLKKILMTCQSTDFARVSLAVNKVGSEASIEELSAATVENNQGAAS
ncbi:MAG: ExbD/TolR family protein [bacterium]